MKIFIILAAILIFAIVVYFVFKLIKKKNKKVDKQSKLVKKKFREKFVIKKKEKSIKKNEENILDIKSSYVDVVDKFLFRKELKVLVLVSKILPKGYIAFPKIGLDTILEPIGKRDLFDKIKNENIDIVIFDEITMKPKVAIDIYDGSIGDEQVDVANPLVVQALEIAKLPLISFKVKTDYSQNEIKEPIFKALCLKVEEDEKDNNSGE